MNVDFELGKCSDGRDSCQWRSMKSVESKLKKGANNTQKVWRLGDRASSAGRWTDQAVDSESANAEGQINLTEDRAPHDAASTVWRPPQSLSDRRGPSCSPHRPSGRLAAQSRNLLEIVKPSNRRISLSNHSIPRPSSSSLQELNVTRNRTRERFRISWARFFLLCFFFFFLPVVSIDVHHPSSIHPIYSSPSPAISFLIPTTATHILSSARYWNSSSRRFYTKIT